ncbi:Origin recognition complex [Gurleya vavrai]
MTVASRLNECNIIKTKIDLFIETKTSSMLHITGVPGSGKTYTITETLKNINYIYLNCSNVKQKNKIFNKILEKFKSDNKSKLKKRKINENSYNNLKNYLQRRKDSFILVIDEIDLLKTKDQSIIYSIINLPYHKNISLFLITISNSFDLDNKINSRIGDNRLVFEPYKTDQLKEILDEKGIKNEQTKNYIARRIAAVSGDSRKAIDLGKECKNCNVIEAEKKIKKMCVSLVDYYLPNLNYYQKLFLYCKYQSNRLNLCYEEFCCACRLRKIEEIEFDDYIRIFDQLKEIGILEKVDNKLIFSLVYEEIEDVLNADKIFLSFNI